MNYKTDFQIKSSVIIIEVVSHPNNFSGNEIFRCADLNSDQFHIKFTLRTNKLKENHRQ